MKTILFDVGANDGSNFSEFLSNGDAEIYAFEPDPNFFPIIQELSHKHSNFHAFPVAVGDAEGSMKFNICPDGGCSSLLDFTTDIDDKWQTKDPRWGAKRVDDSDTLRYFKHTNSINVEVIRLDNFIKKHNIENIDVLHIDTQGYDLRVLQSLGDSVNIVRSGQVEIPSYLNSPLYENQHSKEKTIDFLISNGFEITRITLSDPFDFEENLTFRRRG